MQVFVQNFTSQRTVIVALIMISLCTRQCESLKVKLNTVKLIQMSKDYLPNQVTVQMTTEDNSKVKLNLLRTSHFDIELPVVYLDMDDSGQFVTSTEFTPRFRNVAFYQCVQNEAAFQISRHWNKTSRNYEFNLKGHFRKSMSTYLLNTKNYYSGRNHDEADDSDEMLLTRFEDMPVHLTFLEGREFELSLEKPKRMLTYNLHFVDPTLHQGERKKQNGSQRHKRQGLKDSPSKVNIPRERRATNETYFIDVVIYIDYSLFQFFQDEYEDQVTQNIYEEFAFIFNEIDMLYEGLETPFKLNIILSKIIIAQSAKSSITEKWATKDELYADKSIRCLQEFIYLHGQKILGKHDHCMLFTYYDLYGLEKGEKLFDVMGVANRGAMCRPDGNSNSVIEFSFGYDLISIATHELGHSLGADHDGQENDCLLEDRYIMAATNSDETNETLTNPWYFSPCTHEYISEYIHRILKFTDGVECLNKSVPRMSDLPDVGDRLLGLEFSPDQQCQRIHGSGSYFCRIINASDICHNLWCRDPSEDKQCFNQKAYTGTVCGHYKICMLGECIEDMEIGLNVTEDCVFGDSPGTVLKNQTCTDTVNYNPVYCYTREIRKWCCDSCRKRYRPKLDCEYGDKARGCTPDVCTNFSQLCCETCSLADSRVKSNGIKDSAKSVHHFTKRTGLVHSADQITVGTTRVTNDRMNGTNTIKSDAVSSSRVGAITIGTKHLLVSTTDSDNKGLNNDALYLQQSMFKWFLIFISLSSS